ncbi:hypothetical protein OU631_00940, partial [Escherichia coli]|nr:hypothetical protein [Escherichia coli]
LMMSLWDALRMNMMISYQELVRTFPCLAFPYSRSVHSPPQADNNFICISLYDVNIFRKMPFPDAELLAQNL